MHTPLTKKVVFDYVASQKTLAWLCLLFVPLAFSLHLSMQQLNAAIAAAESERQGLRYDASLYRVLDAVLVERLPAKARMQFATLPSASELIAVHRSLDEKLGASLAMSKAWNSWQQDYLRSTGVEAGAAGNIDRLIELIATTGDNSSLILDPQLISYYLTDLVIETLPALNVFSATVIRASDEARNVGDAESTGEAAVKFKDFRKKISRDYQVLIKAAPRLRNTLQQPFDDVLNVIQQLDSLYRGGLSNADRSDLSIRAFRAQLLALSVTGINAQRRLFNVVALQLDRELANRVDRLYSQRYAAIFIAVAVFLAMLSMFITLRSSEIRLRAAKNSADVANRAKSEFLANMSHEIRTPLNGVLGMAELLQRTILNETQKNYVGTIASSGKTLLAVINDILDFSKVEAGKMRLSLQQFDMADMIDETVASFRSSSVGEVALLVSVAPNVPTSLKGDPIRLQQVLINLLSNAFKFTERGSIRLQVGLLTIHDKQADLQFRVSDSGIGMDKASLLRLFDPFSQVDKNSRRKSRGTGLGLSISQRLVILMGGSIRVTSSVGHGSEFSFTLRFPYVPAPENMDGEIELTGKKLLVVDDNTDYLNIISEQAKFVGMQVIALSEPMKTVERIDVDALPDVIMVDLDMAGLNGIELGRQFSAIPLLATIPRVLVTASCSPPGQDQLVGTGFTGAYIKPSSVKQFRTILGAAFRVGQSIAEVDLPPLRQFEHKKILVAEDNVVNRKVIKNMLLVLGIEPHLVVNGLEAVALLAHRHDDFDAVLMDCDMPEMDGYDATRAIRDYEEKNGKPHIRIIALTAHATSEYHHRSIDAGMNDHLNKPISLDSLSDSLHKNFEAAVKV